MSAPDLIHDVVTARDAGVVGCRGCGKVWPRGTERCARCGEALHSREARALQRVWAWWLVGLMAYIPANLYPMMRTNFMFRSTDSTIVAGAIDLAHHGALGVATIILIASVAIPIGKFVAIAYLALTLDGRTRLSQQNRHRLFELVEFIGRWSMIDVFVVAILSALVQLKVIATINPGPAAITFALSVIFTMLSAQAFDSRMIFDRRDPTAPLPQDQ